MPELLGGDRSAASVVKLEIVQDEKQLRFHKQDAAPVQNSAEAACGVDKISGIIRVPLAQSDLR